MWVKLKELEAENGEVRAVVESPICKNMRITLREEDLKRLIPHGLHLEAGQQAAILQRFIGKWIYTGSIQGREKEGGGKRKMKLTINLKDSESLDVLSVTEALAAKEGVIGLPKKVEEGSIEVELSDITYGRGKSTKKNELLEFIKWVKELLDKNGGNMKGYSLSDK